MAAVLTTAARLQTNPAVSPRLQRVNDMQLCTETLWNNNGKLLKTNLVETFSSFRKDNYNYAKILNSKRDKRNGRYFNTVTFCHSVFNIQFLLERRKIAEGLYIADSFIKPCLFPILKPFVTKSTYRYGNETFPGYHHKDTVIVITREPFEWK